MINILFDLIGTLIKLVVTVTIAVVEFIISLFSVTGEALSIGEALLILLALIAEMIFWAILWVWELLSALFCWRKPKKVAKPILYKRKRKKAKKGEEREEE